MNIILLKQEDISGGTAVITGKKLDHILSFIRPSAGDTLKAGLVNGPMGRGTVNEITSGRLVMELSLTEPPPAPLPLKLVMAMPRPKVLNRVIQHSSAMGVKEIYIIKTWRVEKSYWDTPMLEEANLLRQMVAGLEQGKDTVLPRIEIRKRFKPFVEDELPGIIAGNMALAAHPGAENPCPRGVNLPVTLAIGPEGGFIPYEIESLQNAGFTPVSLGGRILRVETAIPFLIGRLF